MDTSLMSDYIIQQQNIQTQLQNRIFELEEELEIIKNKDDQFNDYFLYRDLLNLLIPNIKFEYDGTENGFYKIYIDPHISMPKTLIDHVLFEIERYKKQKENE